MGARIDRGHRGKDIANGLLGTRPRYTRPHECCLRMRCRKRITIEKSKKYLSDQGVVRGDSALCLRRLGPTCGGKDGRATLRAAVRVCPLSGLPIRPKSRSSFFARSGRFSWLSRAVLARLIAMALFSARTCPMLMQGQGTARNYIRNIRGGFIAPIRERWDRVAVEGCQILGSSLEMGFAGMPFLQEIFVKRLIKADLRRTILLQRASWAFNHVALATARV